MKASSLRVRDESWDSFDAYLFDVDGTLLHCEDAVHYSAFCNTLEILAGRPLTLEGVVAHGNTDVGILRDALKLAGIADEGWRPRLPEIRNAMCSFVDKHKDEFRIIVLPFVREVIEHLRSRGAMLGIATGNLKEIGVAKLTNAGLFGSFCMGGWSDEFESRKDVFRDAVLKMRRVAGPDARICILGDTPADIEAAHANGLPVIAVATGMYSRAHLLRHKPDLCLNSFQELWVNS